MGRRAKDLAGKRFGMIAVIERKGKSGTSPLWLVRCDCGTTKLMRSGAIVDSVSCGCFRMQMLRQRSVTHGMSKTRTYKSWLEMRSRCYSQKAIRYKQYGGRGIRVCDRWRSSFENFLADMGERPENKSLDRINVDGDYSPENCRWATDREQARNTRQVRLTRESADRIKALALEGVVTQRDIAAMFGITQCSVSAIKRGVLWAEGS